MTTNEKNIATLMHLSTLTQYFIPFGNYIFPIIIWSSKENDSEFIDYNERKTNLEFSVKYVAIQFIVVINFCSNITLFCF
jgi:uncharacterized Tic20 family protein